MALVIGILLVVAAIGLLVRYVRRAERCPRCASWRGTKVTSARIDGPVYKAQYLCRACGNRWERECDYTDVGASN